MTEGRCLKPLVPASGSAFEVAPIELRFQCTHAVYAHGGDSPFCYVTSTERGEFIAAALDAWKASGGMQAWLDLRLKPNPKLTEPKDSV